MAPPAGTVRVLRGRAADVEADRAVVRAAVADVRETGEPAVRAWRPYRQVAFGPRDASNDGYGAARRAAREHGFPPHERRVGGRAVAYTGTTVAFARIEPVADVREGTGERYDRALADLRRALADLGVDAHRGEPEDSFCPGSHSLSVDGAGKLVGLAQRVQRGAATVAGILVVDDHETIAEVLVDVYAALEVPLDPDTVGSVVRALGPGRSVDAARGADPDRVARTVEDALVGDRERRVERVE